MCAKKRRTTVKKTLAEKVIQDVEKIREKQERLLKESCRKNKELQKELSEAKRSVVMMIGGADELREQIRRVQERGDTQVGALQREMQAKDDELRTMTEGRNNLRVARESLANEIIGLKKIALNQIDQLRECVVEGFGVR